MSFGLIMLWHVARIMLGSKIRYYYSAAPYHLKYFGFEWVHMIGNSPEQTEQAMRMIFSLMGLAAIGVVLGMFYRISCIILFVTFTYSFLVEATLYQNHYYLMSLLAFLLMFIPANRALSMDAIIFPEWKSDSIPNWCRWILMFQIAVPYIYGGIAKLNSDWLHAFPLGLWVSQKSDLPLIGPLLTERSTHWFMSYAGLFLDLFIVPLLLWKPTRLPSYVVIVLFHLSNAILFPIDVFPWFMILATLIFFPADWPRKLLKKLPPITSERADPLSQLSVKQFLLTFFLAGYVLWQVMFPFRQFAYPGNTSWTEEGHYFSWRMMLRYKDIFVRFYAVDRATNQTLEIPIERLFSPHQNIAIARSPEQIAAAAKFLQSRAHEGGLRDVAIRAVVIISLNGRKPQLMIDPELDLTTITRTLRHQAGIIPLKEPLQNEAWDVPANEWPELLGIELPVPLSDGDERGEIRDDSSASATRLSMSRPSRSPA
ncbi:MAG: HTTM domain-containing protein [Planctomycetaceae bacterium]|nr:HTTM domain-containing protein [Planctomycetaceae bacterium]